MDKKIKTKLSIAVAGAMLLGAGSVYAGKKEVISHIIQNNPTAVKSAVISHKTGVSLPPSTRVSQLAPQVVEVASAMSTTLGIPKPVAMQMTTAQLHEVASAVVAGRDVSYVPNDRGDGGTVVVTREDGSTSELDFGNGGLESVTHTGATGDDGVTNSIERSEGEVELSKSKTGENGTVEAEVEIESN